MNDPIVTILGNCIEAIQQGRLTIQDCLDQYPDYQPELEYYLRIADEINRSSVVKPRPVFVRTARQRLLTKIQPVQQPTILQGLVSFINTLRFNWLTKPAMVAGLAIILVVIGFSTITFRTAQNAVPGDWLYPVKLNLENFQLAMSSKEQAINLNLEFAARRQSEMQILAAKGQTEYIQGVEQDFLRHLDGATEIIATQPQEPDQERMAYRDEMKQVLTEHIQILQAVLANTPLISKPIIQNAITTTSKSRQSLDVMIQPRGVQVSTSTPYIPLIIVNPTRIPLPTATTAIEIKPTATPYVYIPTNPPPTAIIVYTPTATQPAPTATAPVVIPPTDTLTPTPIPTNTATATPVPTNTYTPVPPPTDTPTQPPTPTPTVEPPTNTPVPPTDTPVPPTNTPVPPTPIPPDTVTPTSLIVIPQSSSPTP